MDKAVPELLDKVGSALVASARAVRHTDFDCKACEADMALEEAASRYVKAWLTTFGTREEQDMIRQSDMSLS